MSIKELYQYYQKHSIITTDSRNVPEASLFFALKGENFDGNKYATAALEKGAAFAIIDDATYQKDERCLLVDDVLESLQELAQYHRQQFSIPVIGITGSNGKTTTKELITAVLSSHYPTHATAGNFNNHIGVPLTLLKMPKTTEVAVIEMGANHVGEIAALCAIAMPTHGIITNIGKAHIGEFGGLENIKKAKAELYVFIHNLNGRIFINEEEKYLDELSQGNNVIAYGSVKQLHLKRPYHARMTRSKPFVQLEIINEHSEHIEINSHLVGEYNFRNICTAITVGRYFKVPDAKIKAAIERYIPANNRSQIVERASNTYLLDAYNANPTSMQNALRYFASTEADKKVVLLGDMLELGEYSEAEHREILQLSLDLGFDKTILIGDEFGKIEQQEALHFTDVGALKTWFVKQGFTNTHFLIKGSRGIRLEKVLD